MYMPVQIPVLKKLVGIDYTYCLIYCCAGHIALRLDSYTVVPFLQLHAFMGHGEGVGVARRDLQNRMQSSGTPSKAVRLQVTGAAGMPVNLACCKSDVATVIFLALILWVNIILYI